MTVRLDINANVTGQNQVNQLNRAVQGLGRNANLAATRFGGLEEAAARGRRAFQRLSTTLNVAVAAGFAAATAGATRFIRDSFQAGNLIETSRIQFNSFFRSAEAGGQAFQELTRYASQVPFSLQDIVRGGTPLAAISDTVGDFANNLRIVGNLAATANIPFAEAALQYQRVASAGVAAADRLRDAGITALLGFTSGVQYSAEESVRVFSEAFGPGGRFGGLTQNLASTLLGQNSLIQDAYFRLNATVSEQFFPRLTSQIEGLVAEIEANNGSLESFGRTLGDSLGNAFQSIENGIRAVVDNLGTLRSAFEAFIAFRLASVFGGISAAVVGLYLNLTATTTAATGLNLALRANPVGLIITAFQLAVAALVFFREELSNIANNVIGFFNNRLTELGDGVIILVRQLNRLPGINIELATSTERAAAAADQLRQNYSSLHDEAATGAPSLEELAEAQERVNRAQAENAAFAENRGSIVANARAAVEAANERAQAEIASIDLLLRRDAITGQLTDSERELLEIKRQILEFETQTGEQIGQTAEQIRSIREAAEANRDIVQESLNDYADIGPSIEEAREAIEAQMREWEAVGQVIERISDQIATDIVNGIQQGQSAFEIFSNTARNLLNQLAQQLISSGISSILSGGGSPSGGGGIGGLISGARRIFGFAEGGIVPGGPPYTDRIPALLTPGEMVIPRNEVGNMNNGMTSNVTNINISGNVDDRAISQIRSVVSASPMQVGGANRTFARNSAGLRNRRG